MTGHVQSSRLPETAESSATSGFIVRVSVEEVAAAVGCGRIIDIPEKVAGKFRGDSFILPDPLFRRDAVLVFSEPALKLLN